MYVFGGCTIMRLEENFVPEKRKKNLSRSEGGRSEMHWSRMINFGALNYEA
jgi:hypothetical protein